MTGKRAILIAGPTASGKSAAALRLSEETGGIIVNADSMQVYQELRILSARPSAEDELAAPHRLYGHVSVREWYSVARWLDDMANALREIEGQDRPAIVVGGTGLYFKALTEGLSPMPDIEPDVREYWRNEARLRAPIELHKELKSRDPLTAGRLHPTDPQRIVRALEVFDSTGRPLAEFQETPGTPLLDEGSWEGIVILPKRETLHARADQRFDQMIEAGALQEAATISSMRLDPTLPAMRALGLAPLVDHLNGKTTLQDAILRGKVMTRQYIKRQTTWLRKNMISWKRSQI